MADLPPSLPRRYADAETALILRRAAELQGTAPEPSTAPSLAELEQVAAEAGIEPRYVRQAAAELASPLSPSRTNGILGAPESLWLERVVPGEIPASAFDAVVEEIRSALGMAGQATVLGRGFTWTSGIAGHPAPARAITVTVTPVNGQTVLRAQEAPLGPALVRASAPALERRGLGGGPPRVGAAASSSAPLTFDRSVRRAREARDAFGQPVVAAGALPRLVHSLLHDAPATFACDEEAV
jgi:hypothetical protein